ncbi:hypothetical protein [Streptomyces sp. S.PB5]|uniref:hypothetical protein n=1 Tax=Streptomyces sp. S.PB5 TaxID=3020844 RepID=UPI0025B197D5|nr:hypothetical protein [Streptomyces sp. S.PB5]MDN3021544.1 hypothetical protein [Streptomyces sp. S.PB5]
MRVQFNRPVASPGLSASVGQILDVPEDEALRRIELGHCVALDQPKEGLGKRLRRVLGGKPAADPPGEEPSDRWTVERLKAWAADHAIDLGATSKKADILAAIEAAQTEPTDKALAELSVEELRDYADEQDIALPEDGDQAELLAAIEAALQERA